MQVLLMSWWPCFTLHLFHVCVVFVLLESKHDPQRFCLHEISRIMFCWSPICLLSCLLPA
jgi:hypothetical protein